MIIGVPSPCLTRLWLFCYGISENPGRVAMVDLLARREVDIDASTTAVDDIILPSGASPGAISIDPGDNYAYITDSKLGKIYVLDVNPDSASYNQVVQTISVNATSGLRQIAISSDGHKLFATAADSNIYVVNINPEDRPSVSNSNPRKWWEQIGKVLTPTGAWGLAATPDPHKMVFTNGNANTDGSGFGVLTVSDDPLNWVPTTGYTNLTLTDNNNVFEVNEGVAVTVTADGKYAFVAGRNSKKILISRKLPHETTMLIVKRLRFLFYFGLVVVFLLMPKITMPENTNSENTNSETEKYGLIDKTGKYVVLPQFDYIDDFSEGLARVQVDGKAGYIDKTGKEVIPLQFDRGTSRFSEGLAPAKLKGNNKLGYIDKTGKVVIPPQFDEAYSFSEGVAAVVVNHKYGYINKLGSYVIRPQFEYGSRFYQNRAVVEAKPQHSHKSQTKYALIDQTGNYIVKPTFDQISNSDSYGPLDSLPEFKEGLMRVGMGGYPCHMAMGFVGVKLGYINKMGKVVIPMKFTMTDQFYNGRARVSLSPLKCEGNNSIKWRYINSLGEYVTSLQFDDAHNFYEGLAVVRLGKKSGYIDLSGKFVIPPQFNYLSDFHEGLALASNENGFYGYIDQTGKFVIAPQFGFSSDFSDGSAGVEVNKKQGLIDKTGKYIIEPKFDGISGFSEGLAAVSINDKWGYVDNTGKVVIELKFASSGNFSQGVARVSVKQRL